MTSGLILFNREFTVFARLIRTAPDCFTASAAANAPPNALVLLLIGAGALYTPAFCEVPVLVKVSRLVLWLAALFAAEAAVFDFAFNVLAADGFAVFFEPADVDFFGVFAAVLTAVLAAAEVLLTAMVILFLSEPENFL